MLLVSDNDAWSRIEKSINLYRFAAFLCSYGSYFFIATLTSTVAWPIGLGNSGNLGSNKEYRHSWRRSHSRVYCMMCVCACDVLLMHAEMWCDKSIIIQHYAKKNTIHQVTTMLATSENVIFPGQNHLLTTGTDDSLALKVSSHQYQWLVGGPDLEVGHLWKWLAWWLPSG